MRCRQSRIEYSFHTSFSRLVVPSNCFADCAACRADKCCCRRILCSDCAVTVLTNVAAAAILALTALLARLKCCCRRIPCSDCARLADKRGCRRIPCSDCAACCADKCCCCCIPCMTARLLLKLLLPPYSFTDCAVYHVGISPCWCSCVVSHSQSSVITHISNSLLMKISLPQFLVVSRRFVSLASHEVRMPTGELPALLPPSHLDL